VRNALEYNLPGCRTTISQFVINDPYYDTLLKISKSEADAFFFSVYIWNSDYTNRLINDLVRIAPSTPIVLGGPQVTELENLPRQCSVVIGPIEGVDNTFYQDLKDGGLRALYHSTSRHDFPSPYRKEDFDEYLCNRYVYYESSRGCPFSCGYCLSSQKRGVFHKDIDTVKKEIDSLLAGKPKLIKFVDRTFNDDSMRAMEIWRFLVNRSCSTRFHFELAPDRFTEEMLTFLGSVKPALFQFEIGIQSTNLQTLSTVNRPMNIIRAMDNIARLRQSDNIHLHVDLILGLPYDDIESFKTSFNQVFSVGPHYIQMGLLKVLPGTLMEEKKADFGLVYCRQPPYEILATRWLDHDSIRFLHDFCQCVEAFYNNRYFPSIWSYLLKNGEDPFSFFMSLLTQCEKQNFFEVAHTQEFLTSVLFEVAASRKDKEVFTGLICYDWLRCGHRFLPDFLEQEPLMALRSQLRKTLPQEISELYDYRDRNEFIKKGTFLEISSSTLQSIGWDNCGRYDGNVVACFLPQQTETLIKYNKVVFLQDYLS